ncbi:quaternary amine ABC transporter ATP-binding protein [Cochlodiniinecator piscidefendens]|uniref:quaternary amine ABC transporter ATP-binding protein n=1 Tax=Cochlodiniinecator piscidefendens TaxID=2715756 RepID=UPI00140E5D1D|nr:betaine/proline/choline family ABC transporter ATP-binding protein [Cochlodiniinecator piscidefendens]
MSDPKIRIRNLYKIFGARAGKYLPHVLSGMGKSELLESHGHALGLNNINIDMQAGEISVIMGLSGSGKSTLIRHINRLIEPTSGEILLDGQDIMRFSQADLLQTRQKSMSMVFQNFALLPHRTVLQNVSMGLKVQGVTKEIREHEGRKWLLRVGLKGHESQYPNQLSGGMQQRVGIARALTSNSDILLMDEAFSALDPLIRTDMQDLLLELQTELHKTIVFITHDLDEALKLADHLVILKDGAVVQQGKPQHILLNPSDPYIEEFIADINRARVLRVRSIMRHSNLGNEYSGTIDPEANLEQVIGMAQGDMSARFEVIENNQRIGEVDVALLMDALVPYRPDTAKR